MRKLVLFAFLTIIFSNVSAQFASQNISLLSIFNDTTVVPEPQFGLRYQSCWGWADPLTGREYGVIGSTSGTYIIEVTNPLAPVKRDYVSSRRTNLVWHEYKTYGNYLYIISDGPATNQLQICDMTYLPDSVHVVYDSNVLFNRAHTITIDGNKMYLANVSGSVYHSMQVYSLNNPELPVLLRSLDQDYPDINQVHDMTVSNDTVYASCGNQGLHIYKYDSIANTFTEIGALTTYPEQGYNHSTALSGDHSTLYMCDETTGKAVKVVNLADIANPSADTIFRSHVGAIAHNPYVKDNYLYIAYYLDGVYVYDISNPLIPVLAGFFDTHPQNGNSFPANTYEGCWAVYTDLPSGVLLASDMQYGLFCLDADRVTGLPHFSINNQETMVAFPNPARDEIKIMLKNVSNESIRIEITDELGRVVKQSIYFVSYNGEVTVQLDNFLPGIYFVKASTSEKVFVSKVNVVN